MILNSIKLENFRSFQGLHSIELQTKKNKPIIMIGGLNGAGKTSILTAIKLGLFGKASLKGSITTKSYSSYMKEQINKDSRNVNFASVAIDFDFVKQGKNYHYLIDRSWKVNQNKLTESLSVYENNTLISGLSLEQAQGFIFDLIPIGVANLFFFDGEMISEMADDQDGKILIDALKKLVGADLIEKAAFDTGVVLRNRKKDSLSINKKNHILKLEEELKIIEQRIEKMNDEYSNSYLPKQAELSIKLRNARQKLDERGGAWSQSRDNLIIEQGSIMEKKKELESKIIELLRGDIIFSVAPNFSKSLLSKLSKDLSLSNSLEFNKQIDRKLSELKIKDKSLKSFAEQLKENQDASPKYQISTFQLTSIEKYTSSSNQSKANLTSFLDSYEEIESKLDDLGQNIARAPNEEDLKNIYQNIHDIEIEIEKWNYADKDFRREITGQINIAIKLTYELDKAYEKIETEDNIEKVQVLGQKSIEAMNRLSKSLTQEKISALEFEFNKAFKRLIRKKDMTHLLKIDRESYKIEMFSDSGKILNKKNISSGEKQIYAFAMLESLGKVSGRPLPFIIDTPLGRLDSYHRIKLIENFFPKIGEQVIILSTDTEINSEFYDLLSPYISQSNKIVYNQSENSSSIKEGYFKSNDMKEDEFELLA